MGIRLVLRKRAMMYLWRAQQSGAIISIALLGTLTAASLYNDYLRERFNNFGLDKDNVLGGVMVTMAIIFAGVFGVGYMFDRAKFWKEQNIVAIERNPYGSYKLNAKEVYWIRIWTASVLAGNPSPDLKDQVALFQQWIKRSMEEDQVLRAEVAAVEKWIRTGDSSALHMLNGDT
jgi:hypothetical protein